MDDLNDRDMTFDDRFWFKKFTHEPKIEFNPRDDKKTSENEDVKRPNFGKKCI